MSDILETLRERGQLADCTDAEGLRALIARERVTFYNGFDPTADSLTIGNLVPVMNMVRLQRAGLRPIAVVGGATGMIGDPSGKSAERNLQGLDQIRHNLECQKVQLRRFLDFEGPAAALVENNFDWLSTFSFIDFLRDVGKNFRVNDMIRKESVRSRLEGETGLSFTEFSYMLLQAYDFQFLKERHGCLLQTGGADQWGNITAGIDLIRRTSGAQAYGLTFPLLLTADGKKVGKTEAGSVWLDANKTSVFDFYQYWVRADDRDVERLLFTFTHLPAEEVRAIAADHARAPEKREGQKRLAFEVTSLVHGESEATKARDAAGALYETRLADLSDDRLRELFPDVPSVTVAAAELEAGLPVDKAIVAAGLAPSRKEAQRVLAQGGLYVNNQPWDAAERTLTRAHLASESMLLLRAGKKRYCLVKVE